MSIVTSERMIVLECQTDVFQNTSLLIPLNEGLTAWKASENFTAYCYQQTFNFVIIIYFEEKKYIEDDNCYSVFQINIISSRKYCYSALDSKCVLTNPK